VSILGNSNSTEPQRKSVKKTREVEPDPFESDESPSEKNKKNPAKKLFVPDSDEETEATQPNNRKKPSKKVIKTIYHNNST
jgi:hypothetical protein